MRLPSAFLSILAHCFVFSDHNLEFSRMYILAHATQKIDVYYIYPSIFIVFFILTHKPEHRLFVHSLFPP